MSPGDLVRVEGQGSAVFRFAALGRDGSLTCWGPLDKAYAGWRSFRPEACRLYRPRSHAGRYER